VIKFFHSSDTGEKMGVQSDRTSSVYRHQETFHTLRSEVLYGILSGTPTELVGLAKLCLNETYSESRKHLSGTFPVEKQ
jgi:hypothetical protein